MTKPLHLQPEEQELCNLRELLHRVATGDRNALDDVYQSHLDLMLSWIREGIRCHHLAIDPSSVLNSGYVAMATNKTITRSKKGLNGRKLLATLDADDPDRILIELFERSIDKRRKRIGRAKHQIGDQQPLGESSALDAEAMTGPKRPGHGKPAPFSDIEKGGGALDAFTTLKQMRGGKEIAQPMDPVIDEVCYDELTAAIDQLPDDKKLRDIAKDRLLEEMTYGEIAAKHGISEKMAERRAKAACDELRIKLATTEDTSG